MKVIETVWIPMPDGTRLAARLWLPEGEGPWPCILEYIPYRRRDRTRMRDESMHPHFAAAGYAAIRVDQRGSGDSDGNSGRSAALERELSVGVGTTRDSRVGDDDPDPDADLGGAAGRGVRSPPRSPSSTAWYVARKTSLPLRNRTSVFAGWTLTSTSAGSTVRKIANTGWRVGARNSR